MSQTTYVTHFTMFTLVSEVTSALQAVISDNESYLLRLECCFDGQPIQKTPPRMDASRNDFRRTSLIRVSAIWRGCESRIRSNSSPFNLSGRLSAV